VSLISTFLSRTGHWGDGLKIIPISLLEKHGHLGSGGQAAVFSGTWKQASGSVESRSARAVALKYYKFEISTDDAAEVDAVTRRCLKSFLRELRVMASPMAHRANNLIQVFGISFEEISRYGRTLYRPIVVVERAWKSLTAFVEDGGLDSTDFDRHQVEESLMYGLLRGLDFLHLQGIVHGDLKPDNILMFREPCSSGGERVIGRLSDFGLTEIVIHRQSEESSDAIEALQDRLETLPLEGLHMVGTEYWRAPETYVDSEYSSVGNDYPFSRDFYSLGLVTYYVLFQSRLPPDALSRAPAEQNERALKQAVNAAFSRRWRFRSSGSASAKQLVECPSPVGRLAKFTQWRKSGEVSRVQDGGVSMAAQRLTSH
jgi:serine/threonine protein kinase